MDFWTNIAMTTGSILFFYFSIMWLIKNDVGSRDGLCMDDDE